MLLATFFPELSFDIIGGGSERERLEDKATSNVRFLGKLSHIGIGSAVCQNVDIANNTIIGGKSFVNKNCEKNSVYFGTPAKKRKNRKIGAKYL